MPLMLAQVPYLEQRDKLAGEAVKQIQDRLNLTVPAGKIAPGLKIDALPYLLRGRSPLGDARLGETVRAVQLHLNLQVPAGKTKPALALRELPYLTQKDARLGETFRLIQDHINTNRL